MDGGRAMGFDLGESLFPDGGDNDFIALDTGGVEHKKRKATVARDQTDALTQMSKSGTPPNCNRSTRLQST